MSTIKLEMPETDLNHDGHTSFGELVTYTLVLGGGLFVALNALVIAICILFGVERWWRPWLSVWVPLLMILVTLIALALFVWRLIVPEKGEVMSFLDWRQKRARERWEFDQVRGLSSTEAGTRLSQADQDYYLRLYLLRWYQHGKLSRDQWEADGLPKRMWDRANELAKKHRIRKAHANKLEPVTFADAWGLYCDALVRGRRWIKNGDDLLTD